MVKFGTHVAAIRDGDLVHANLYLVPYNQMKKQIEYYHTPADPPATTKMARAAAAAVAGSVVKYQQNPTTKEGDGLSTTTVSTATLSSTDEGSAAALTAAVTAADTAETATFAGATQIPATVEILPPQKPGETDDEYFIRIWKKSLQEAEDDLQNARAEIWRTIFDEIAAAAADDHHDDDDHDRMQVHELIRGVNPGNAFKLYVGVILRRQHKKNTKLNGPCMKVGCNQAQELLVRLKKIHRAATTNSEGLRKLVKKCDKKMNRSSSSSSSSTEDADGTTTQHRRRSNAIQHQLSSTLLPLLYTSSLYTSQSTLSDGIDFLRDLLSEAGGIGNTSAEYEAYYPKLVQMNIIDGRRPPGEYTTHHRNSYAASSTASRSIGDNGSDAFTYDSNFKPIIKRNSEARHQESMDNRMMELDWLKLLVKSISHELLPKLVSHRGFHSIKDHSDKRPLENSLSAYEIAWTSGIELCECDIALTKDEKLVLAHDENFMRLSLDQGRDGASQKRIGDLTFKELISLPLINGVRPPLLIDVLRSASAISEKSKLVIEIKPGNTEAAIALSRMLIRHPDLRSSVAMIMSFDVGTMHRLRSRLKGATAAGAGGFGTPLRGDESVSSLVGQYPAQQHRRVTSYDHFGTSHRRVTSYDHFGTMTASPNLGPAVHPFQQGRASMEFGSSIGLSISHIDLNDATNTNNSTSKLTAPTSPPVPPSVVSTNAGGTAASTPVTSKSVIGGGSSSTGAVAAMHHKHSMPKLMLLTVADSPKAYCEMEVHTDELHRVDRWLTEEDGALDGVYLQFEKKMLTKEGAAYLRKLSERLTVGVWNYAERDPDDYDTFHWLVKEGNCTFVNTDLPKNFRNEILFQNQQRAASHSPPRGAV